MAAAVRIPVVPGRRLGRPTATSLLDAAWRRVRHPLQGAPLTAAMLLALAVTSVTLAGARPRGASIMALRASTNLHNLTSHPIEVLFVSIFWVSAPWVFWPVSALMLTVLAGAERRIGSARTGLVFLAGHVAATLLTVTGIALGIAQAWLPSSLTYAVDVGPSYGLAAVAAALITGVPTRERRWALTAALVAGLGVAVAVDQTFTDVGHLVAALIGFMLAHTAVAQRRHHRRGVRRPEAVTSCRCQATQSAR